MPTFLDESGETGLTRSSSPFFRLSGVWMPRSVEDEFRASIRDLRRALGVPGRFEFKFARTHSSHERRRGFLDTALQFPFRFAFCSIEKRRGRWASAPKAEIHWAAATSLSVGLRPVYHEAEKMTFPLRDSLIVDDNGDAAYLRKVENAFRGLKSNIVPQEPLVLKPRFRDSHKEEGLQLADMVCGACGARADGDSVWFDLISERCCDFAMFP
jgi:hypothetical protein